MKQYTGNKVLNMMARATETRTVKVKVKDDPWWGTAYETIKVHVIDGREYTEGHDRDGWPTLTER